MTKHKRKTAKVKRRRVAVFAAIINGKRRTGFITLVQKPGSKPRFVTSKLK